MKIEAHFPYASVAKSKTKPLNINSSIIGTNIAIHKIVEINDTYPSEKKPSKENLVIVSYDCTA